MLATRVGQLVTYVPRADRGLPADLQTRFTLRSLPARLRMKVMDRCVGVDAEAQVELAEPGSGMYTACQYGIETWEGLRDEDGRDVPCLKQNLGNHKMVTDASLDRIGGVIMEIGAEIMRQNRLDQEERGASLGNSSSSPTLPAGGPSSTATGESSVGRSTAPPAAGSP
jgi:hypothetical protein